LLLPLAKPTDLPLRSGVSVHTPVNFVARLKTEGSKIKPWSGRGRCYDNILVEKTWRNQSNMRRCKPARLHDGWEAEISLSEF